MAHHVTCHTCGDSLPAFQAVLRSVSLEQIAYHPDCFAGVRRPRPGNTELMRRLGLAS